MDPRADVDDPGLAWREEALRASARAGRALIEAAAEGFFLELDEDEARFSASVAPIFGDPGALGPLAWLEGRLHPAHRPRFLEGLAAHRAAPEAVPFAYEVALRHPTLGWRHHRGRAASRPAPEGAARRTVLAFRDVEDERTSARRAEAAEARIETLERALAEARSRPALRAPTHPSRVRRAHEGADPDRRAAVRQALDRARSAARSLAQPDLGPARGLLEDARRAFEAIRGPLEVGQEGALQEAAAEAGALLEELALVALNAQLEALRLGGGGSGLAAVAARMKQLAKEAGHAAAQLSEQIGAQRAGMEGARAKARHTEGLLAELAERMEVVTDAIPAERLAALRASLSEAEHLVAAGENAAPSPPIGG